MLTLSRIHSRDLVEVNTAKVAILTVAASASVSYLATTNAIRWPPALWLATGAAAGSFLASRWTVNKGHAAVRIVVLLVCTFALIRFGSQAFLQ